MGAALRRLKRLSRMSAEELGFRARERARRAWERAAHALAAAEPDDAAFLARLPAAPDAGDAPDGPARSKVAGAEFTSYLRRRFAPRFPLPADAAGRAALVERWLERYPRGPSRLAAEADRLRDHRFELLGYGEVACGREVDWHRDPVTRRVWPRRFWTRYELVGGPAAADPKRIHELGRLQHLPRLGRAFLVLGDERCAREVVAQMLAWIDQNPPGVGVHWHSSLEIALRTLSWLWALAFVLPSAALDETSARRIGKSLFAQLDHVRRHPSLYSSPNTHLLGEAVALYVGGTLFHDCEPGPTWRAAGLAWLERELDRQVDADGLHRELSPWYQCYAIEFYLLALTIAPAGGRGLEPRVAARVERMLEALMGLARPDGSLPLLGDDDGGRALALGATHYRDPADLWSTGAVLFDRGDFKARAGLLREETLWLLGAGAATRFQRLAARWPDRLDAAFPEAGYFVQRDGWGANDAQLVFDCGGLGGLGGGHGHADALSVTLDAGGRELLVDPGTYTYNGAPVWRDFFRSTHAHNCVVIDGRSQCEPAGTFGWRRSGAARLLERASFDGLDFLAGEHESRAPGGAGLVHRRRLLHVRGDYWLVIDDFRESPASGGSSRSAGSTGGREHGFEVLYHLAPDADVHALELASDARDSRLLAISGSTSLLVALHAAAPMAVRVVRGRTSPPQGWVSRRYGEKRRASVIVARFVAELPTAVVSVLMPMRTPSMAVTASTSNAVAATRRRETSGGPALAVEVRATNARHRDLAVVSLAADELVAGQLRGRGELFWARSDGGSLERLLAVQARSGRWRGEELFSSLRPVTDLFLGAGAVPSDLPSVAGTYLEQPDVRHRRSS